MDPEHVGKSRATFAEAAAKGAAAVIWVAPQPEVFAPPEIPVALGTAHDMILAKTPQLDACLRSDIGPITRTHDNCIVLQLLLYIRSCSCLASCGRMRSVLMNTEMNLNVHVRSCGA